MTTKAAFNAEEWTTVVNGPPLAGMYVSQTHRGGTLRESLAMGAIYQNAREHAGESPLLDDLLASAPAIDAQQIQAHRDDLGDVVADGLRAAVEIIERRATRAELDAYKTFVMRVAQAVAEAHREGGFLGLGGRAVSDEENVALDKIANALGPPPAGAITP